MTTAKDRVQLELFELEEKHCKLYAFLNSLTGDLSTGIAPQQVELMKAQGYIMSAYIQVLRLRLEAWN